MSKFENIKVAVAMATCNTDSEMLFQAVESILNQTHENFIFYIVNDSGNNLSQLRGFADNRIVIVEHDEKLGLAQSMNEILYASKEKYVFRMDADDISVPNRFEMQIDFMEKNKEVDVASMFCKKFGAENGFMYTMWTKSNDIKALTLFANAFYHSSVVLRNSFFQENDIRYNPSFSAAQDYDLWSRCAQLTKLSIIPQIGLFYRVHGNQISSGRKNIQKSFANKVRKDNLRKLGLDETYYKYLEMLIDVSLIDDFSTFSEVMVKIVDANKIACVYNQRSLFNVISYFYLRACIKMRNILFAIRYSKTTRKMVLNPSNIIVSISKVKILHSLNRQMKQINIKV